jgi:FkbH-like protein
MSNDVYKWPRLIRSLKHFAKFEVTADDKFKTSQYHGRARFVRDSANISNVSSYLKGINLQPVPLNLSDALLSRAVQLCSKTNQYNLRTIRHSAEDLIKLKSFNDDFCFLVSLSDNYGDHGIVALVCLKKLDQNILFIDTFLMSCRVLGRYLEAWILKEIVSRATNNGFSYVVGEFISTERNIVAQNFFEMYGFEQVQNESEFHQRIISSNFTNGGDIYIFSITNTNIPYIDIYEKN